MGLKEMLDSAIAVEKREKEIVSRIITDYADNIETRIIELLKINNPEIDSDVEFAIRNWKEPEKIIDRLEKTLGRLKTKSNAPRSAREKAAADARNVYYKTGSLVKKLEIACGVVNRLIQSYAPKGHPGTNQYEMLPPPGKNIKKASYDTSFEDKLLSLIISYLRDEAERIWNNRPIDDDDDSATPLTFFDMRRITRYLSTLPDENSRLAYLRKMKRCRYAYDERGYIIVKGVRKLQEQQVPRNLVGKRDYEHFFVSLQREIDVLENELRQNDVRHSSIKQTIIESDSDDTQEILPPMPSDSIAPRTGRQVFLVLNLLLSRWYPSSNKTQRAGLMSFVSGYSEKKLRQFFSKSDWEKQISDLQQIKDVFQTKRLGSKVLSFIESEIKELQKNLNSNSDKES